MQQTFNLTNATASFGFNSGDNPNRDIITRADATAAYLATLNSAASKVTSTAFTIPVGVATTNFTFPAASPANGVITNISVLFKEDIDLGAGGTLSLTVGSTSGGAEICPLALVDNAGGGVDEGSVQGINQAPSQNGAAFTFTPGGVRYFTADQTLFIQTIVGVNALAASVDAIFVVNYSTI